MSFCTSSLSSFSRILEAEHSHIPRNEDAVQGLHLPGARPLRLNETAPPPYELNPTVTVNAPDANVATENTDIVQIERAETTQDAALPDLLIGQPIDINAGAQVDPPVADAGAILQDNMRQLVRTFNRRLLPLQNMARRWFRRAIRSIGPGHRRQDIA